MTDIDIADLRKKAIAMIATLDKYSEYATDAHAASSMITALLDALVPEAKEDESIAGNPGSDTYRAMKVRVYALEIENERLRNLLHSPEPSTVAGPPAPSPDQATPSQGDAVDIADRFYEKDSLDHQMLAKFIHKAITAAFVAARAESRVEVERLTKRLDEITPHAEVAASLRKHLQEAQDARRDAEAEALIFQQRIDGALAIIDNLHAKLVAAEAEVERLTADKDSAYHERNQVVAALAHLYPSGIGRTDIPGWLPEWHRCVYIDLPTGQVSWHYHDREADLFADLPPYAKPWDGHDTPEKYRRLVALRAESSARKAGEEMRERDWNDVSTAPKDGRWFGVVTSPGHLYRVSWGNGRHGLGWYTVDGAFDMAPYARAWFDLPSAALPLSGDGEAK